MQRSYSPSSPYLHNTFAGSSYSGSTFATTKHKAKNFLKKMSDPGSFVGIIFLIIVLYMLAMKICEKYYYDTYVDKFPQEIRDFDHDYPWFAYLVGVLAVLSFGPKVYEKVKGKY